MSGAIIYDNVPYKHKETGTVVLAKERVYEDDESDLFTAIPLCGENEGEYLEGWAAMDFREISDNEDDEEDCMSRRDWLDYARHMELLPKPANWKGW